MSTKLYGSMFSVMSSRALNSHIDLKAFVGMVTDQKSDMASLRDMALREMAGMFFGHGAHNIGDEFRKTIARCRAENPALTPYEAIGQATRAYRKQVELRRTGGRGVSAGGRGVIFPRYFEHVMRYELAVETLRDLSRQGPVTMEGAFRAMLALNMPHRPRPIFFNFIKTSKHGMQAMEKHGIQAMEVDPCTVGERLVADVSRPMHQAFPKALSIMEKILSVPECELQEAPAKQAHRKDILAAIYVALYGTPAAIHETKHDLRAATALRLQVSNDIAARYPQSPVFIGRPAPVSRKPSP